MFSDPSLDGVAMWPVPVSFVRIFQDKQGWQTSDLQLLLALWKFSRAEVKKCSFKVRNLTKAPDDQRFHLIQWKEAVTNSAAGCGSRWLIYSWLPAMAAFFKKPLNLTSFGAAFTLEPSCDGPSCCRVARSVSRVARLLCSGASAGFDCSAGLQLHGCFQARLNKHLETLPLMSAVLIELQARHLAAFWWAQLYPFLLRCGNTLWWMRPSH